VGGRALLPRFGDWPIHHACHWPKTFPRYVGWAPSDGHALSIDSFRTEHASPHGTANRLVQQPLRRPNGGCLALRAVSQQIPGVFAAVDDGKQRQTRHRHWNRSHAINRPDLLGRAWY
jgi:hypothetical protein